jgi:replicative DNA helicase
MAVFSISTIPTPDGWVAASSIQKGDLVFDHHGNPTPVINVQEYAPTECYEVTFEDGLTVQGDKHLTFMAQDRPWRNCFTRYKNYGEKKYHRGMSRPLIKLPVSDSIEIRNGSRLNYSVPNCLPVRYPTRTLPVPPYIFGVWFASLTPTGRLWVRDKPINKIQKVFRGYGHFIKTRKHKNGDVLFDIRPSVRDSFLFAGLSIPTSLPFYYLDGSVEQRIELLEGLIDGGLIKKYKGSNLYVAKEANYHLMRKLQGLIESLGIKTTLHTPYNSACYSLKFRTNDNFEHLHGENRRFVHKIEKIAPKQCTHIETDTQFLVGEGFIPVC